VRCEFAARDAAGLLIPRLGRDVPSGSGHGNPRVKVGRGGKVLMAIAHGGTVTCTAERGTMFTTGSDHWCSDTLDPPGPFTAVGRAAQRRCAKALSHKMKTLTITVDGVVFDINKPRFADFTPMLSLTLPVGNIFEVPPKSFTMTAYGWTALVGNLRVGRHVIVVHVVDGDADESGEHIIDIVPRNGRSDDDGEGDDWTMPTIGFRDRPVGDLGERVRGLGGGIVASTFVGNRCDPTGPDLGGGAVRALSQYHGEPVTVAGSTFTRGSCSNGAALSSIGVSWEISDSVFTHNRAVGRGANPARAGTAGGGSGGALYFDGNAFTVLLAGTRMSGNHAREGGGAVFLVSNDRSGVLTIRDSTLRDNPSDGFQTDPGIFFLGRDQRVIRSAIG
jgi:hypothetical protein